MTKVVVIYDVDTMVPVEMVCAADPLRVVARYQRLADDPQYIDRLLGMSEVFDVVEP